MKKHAKMLEQVKISFCVGDVLDPTILQAAGCHTCSRIITLSPSSPIMEKTSFDGVEMVIKSEDKKDENNILLMMILEEYKDIWQHDVHILFDWYSPTSMNLLPIPPLKDMLKKRISGDYNLIFEKSRDEEDIEHMIATSSSPNEPSSLPPIKDKSIFKSFNKVAALNNPTSETTKPSKLPPKSLPSSSSTISMDGLSANFLLNRQHSRDKQKSISQYISAIHTAKTIKMKTGNVSQSSSPVHKKKIKTDNLFNKKLQIKIRKEKEKEKLRKRSSNVSYKSEKEADGDSDDSSDSSDDDDYDTGIQSHHMSSGDLEFSNRIPRGNCRFAAGYTIPKPCVASLYSMAYYTPGFLEIIEALLNPAEYDQESIPWLFMIPPKYNRKEYSIVARELLEAGFRWAYFDLEGLM
jgi:hypothetical protein